MRKYTLLLGAGILLLSGSCGKERLTPANDHIDMERLFHETDNDTTNNTRNWDKQYHNDDESEEESPDVQT